ncbi:coiled-coil domain-containing protein mad1 [Podochytrium sp. JEL0797]|nr:coiled-coil domain-containing protein mad1 [Podochytrium sp. JEL0797]
MESKHLFHPYRAAAGSPDPKQRTALAPAPGQALPLRASLVGRRTLRGPSSSLSSSMHHPAASSSRPFTAASPASSAEITATLQSLRSSLSAHPAPSSLAHPGASSSSFHPASSSRASSSVHPTASSSSFHPASSSSSSLRATSRLPKPKDASFDLFTDSEILDARKTIKALERELLNQREAYEKRVASLESDNNALKVEKNEALAKIKKLETDQAFLMSRDNQLVTANESREKAFDQKNNENRSIIAKLRSEKSSLTEQLSIAQERSTDAERKLEHESSVSKRELSRLRAKLESTEHERDLATAGKGVALNQLSELQNKAFSLESQLSSLKRNDSIGITDTIKKQLNEQSAYIHNLETTVSQLRSETQRLRTLHQTATAQTETIRTLETQLSRMDAMRSQVVELESLVQSFTAEKERWVAELAAAGGSMDEWEGVTTPLGFARVLRKERLERAREGEKVAEEVAQSRVLRETVVELEEEVKALKDKCGELERGVEVREGLVKRLEKGRELMGRENLVLREQWAAANFQDEKGATDELHALVNEYKTRVQELEHELSIRSPMQSSTARSDLTAAKRELDDKVKELQSEIDHLKSENASLQSEVETYDTQVFELERAIGQGAFDRKTLKVLQLAENPESTAHAIRKETLDSLEAENKALKSRLLGSEWGALVPVEVVKSAEVEHRRLLAVVEEKEKRILRLREVFTAKSQEFKEAVFSLLGYKVEFLESRVRLISQYADPHHDASFLFASQENDHGTMQIVGGTDPERVKELQRLREKYVGERGSVPAFLAVVTLDGWERTFGVEDMEQ